MVEFKILEGNLGISFSGGADSSLVLYMLMRDHPGEITIFTTSCDRTPKHIEAVMRVYNKCKELTGHTNSTLINTHIIGSKNKDNLFITPMQYLKEGKLDYVYTGLTANPPIKLNHEEQKVQHREERRKKNIDDNNFYLPFVNENKQTIAILYEEFNLVESLFPLTFSCVASQTLDHCNACWWCEERKWGFGKL